MERLASVLDVPAAYFYAKSDDMADLLIAFHRAGPDRQRQLLELTKKPE